ncbi:cryptochrome/photolyase family protein [Isachenkonia alkalipeptolytica]|uniref:Cryptochrome/photolyase family protein n=1 Tax=Isachenkonia alkalipeptolytica TaxID=2565777 RepID=A0AA43XHZ3_9CLOT|nr:cryptochrome/photolyase family protein [Isachenkonia alkalipeptolytica]NBG87175.1 cryptochrome/photolyase family protein [Isachenkonia alkalipeptolytica]
MKTLWILGDQLNKELAGFKEIDPKKDIVLMIESKERSRLRRVHKQKVVLIFSAMRHFARDLIAEGYRVDYREAPSFTKGLEEHFNKYNSTTCLVHEPTDYFISKLFDQKINSIDKLTKDVLDKDFSSSSKIKFEENFSKMYDLIDFKLLSEEPLFLVPKKDWGNYLTKNESWKQDKVYRRLRKEFNILMDGDRPLGCKWSYDTENRKPPKEGLHFEEAIKFIPDRITREVMAKIQEEYSDYFGETDSFSWPVTRKEALEALNHFIDRRLKTYGDYQDAMLTENPLMSHSLLSGAINIGLITPKEVIDKAESAYHQKKAPLPAVEGFIRQILGWREYVRGVYLRSMPKYEKVNYFGHQRSLPEYFWTGKTDLHCVATAVMEVKKSGYNHHIQRLMVLGNWANLLRIRPQEVSEWFLEVYADAYEWVVLPNVLGMALYADGGLMSTKPYVSSGKYIQRMSNYCDSCHYDINDKAGEKACPFHALYWTFLEDHRGLLGSNPRMRLMYANWDRQKEENRDALLKKGRELLKEAKAESPTSSYSG